MNRSVPKAWVCGLALLIAALCAQSAPATSCLQVSSIIDRNISLRPTPWATGQGDIPPDFLTIPKFNSANGTLCLVVVRLSANLDAQVAATNNGPVQASLTATMHVNATIQAPNPIGQFTAEPLSSMQSLVVPASGTVNFIAQVDSSREDHFVAQTDLNAFTGTGSLFLSANATGDATVTTDTGSATITTLIRAGVAVHVEYWVVPEPASLSLLALGALLVRRRRFRR